MKIKIKTEIGILMYNWVTVKNGSDRLLGSQVVKQEVSWMRNTTFRENTMFLCCYGKF